MKKLDKLKNILKLKFDSAALIFKSEKKKEIFLPFIFVCLKDFVSKFPFISLKIPRYAYSNILKIIKEFKIFKNRLKNLLAFISLKWKFLTNWIFY